MDKLNHFQGAACGMQRQSAGEISCQLGVSLLPPDRRFLFHDLSSPKASYPNAAF
jgi:hypothetical protein